MRDLWNQAGRFLANRSIPADVVELARDHFNAALGRLGVDTAGIHPMQEKLEGAHSGHGISLFTSGEIIRWAANDDSLPIFENMMAPQLDGASEAFYECLGLMLFDNAFLQKAKNGDFRSYTSRLSFPEGHALMIHANDPNTDTLCQRFRELNWEGTECRVAYEAYPGYVHRP